MSNDAEFIKEFLIESHENLDKIETHLVLLEKSPETPESLAEVFRAFHTIKGTSRFFEFKKLETMTHAGEDLLGRIRDKKQVFNRPVADALLGLLDGIRRELGAIEKTGKEGDVDPLPLVTALVRAEHTAGPRAPQEAADNNENKETGAETGAMESVLRIDVRLSDRLMAQVGELVLTRNHLLQRAAFTRDPAVGPAVQRLNFITSELQGQVMKMRLQPMSSLWSKFPRLVRDLSASLGKEVRLVMEGGETELDKSILDAIRDPLTHLLRNSVDHGLEAPDARRAAQKPETGELRLRAYHEGGIVNIEVADDGQGLSSEKIREKALERNLLSADQLDRLTEAELWNLIFLPGFSTAQKVTNVSGRGVGLDVVKSNLDKIGGSVDVRSMPGKGASFRLKIPLTLAIIPALIVASQGRKYAIPQVGLRELIRLRAGSDRIEKMQGVPVFRHRGALLPVISLNETLSGQASTLEEKTLLILLSGERLFGLMVESVIDTEEIVVKPLGRHLKPLKIFEGATILGDGDVILILDVFGLGLATHVVSETAENTSPGSAPTESARAERTETLLLLRGPDDGRLALPLSSITRLEEFPVGEIERAGDREVWQYRGEILPLVRLSAILEERRTKARVPSPTETADSLVSVVVFGEAQGKIGLIVEGIIDIVNEILPASRMSGRHGVSGTTIVRGRVTELLGIEALLRLMKTHIEGDQP